MGMNMEQAQRLNTVAMCPKKGGLWASFFDWLLGSGVEHLLAICTLGTGGGGHLWFSLVWEADYWQHEVILIYTSCPVRVGDTGLGLLGTRQEAD